MFKRLLLSLLLFSNVAHGAVAATTVWEIRTGGSSNNGGGFDTAKAGTDYSQQNSAQYNFTDLASTNATTNPCVVTSASHNFVTADEGNIIHITAGTNWTAEFYEIVSTSGNAATLDRACGSSASISGGTFFVGGAYKLGAASDSTFFSRGVAGNTWYFKNDGTNHSTTVNDSPTVGTATAMDNFIGYQTTRTDAPTGSNRPQLNMNSAVFAIGFANFKHMRVFGSAASMFQAQNGTRLVNSKFVNNASIAGPGRNAVNCTSNCQIFDSEMISWNGNGLNVASGTHADVTSSYIHDSNVCVNLAAGTGSVVRLVNNVLASCQAQGLNITSAVTNPSLVVGNTFYGQETPISSSTGIKTITGSSEVMILNNIIYGFSTAMANPDTNSGNYNDYNNFYNNTADITTWGKGSNSYALAPGFGNVTNIRGTSATSSGQVLTDSGANFSGVTDNLDTVYVSANTGGNTGAFLITGHTSTTLTVDSAIGALGTGSSITYVVTLGHNFAVSPSMKWKAKPTSFTGSNTTSYLDLGGVQRHEYGKAVGK